METQTPTPARGWYFFDGLMSRHGKTKIDNNTYLSRTEVDGDLLYVVTLHDTDILVFNRTRRTVRLRAGEWRTDLTKRRMNAYLVTHGLRIGSYSPAWWTVERVVRGQVAESVPFVEDMEVAL